MARVETMLLMNHGDGSFGDQLFLPHHLERKRRLAAVVAAAERPR